MHRPSRKFEAARHHHTHHHHDHEPHAHRRRSREESGADRTRHRVQSFLALIAPIVLVGCALALYLFGVIRVIPITRGFQLDIALLITFLVGFNILYQAVAKLLQFKLSVDLALVVAVVAAIYLREYLAAAEVVFIMMVGEALEDYAATRTHAAIEKLMDLAPQRATVRRDGAEIEIGVEELNVGDTVIVKPGERLAADGVVREGRTAIDQSVLTGESIPAEKGPGDAVFGGSVNRLNRIEFEATHLGADSKLGQIVRLVEEAQAAKAPIERAADRYAAWFLPLVIGAASLTWFLTQDLMRVASVLIIACPCALVLATPTAVLAAMARMAREGILVKGGRYLEAMARADVFFFDKTGTITQGDARISNIVSLGRLNEDELLLLAASAEGHSSHLFARIIIDEAERRGLKLDRPGDVRVEPGLGLRAEIEGREFFIGNERLLHRYDIKLSEPAEKELAGVYERGESAVLIAQRSKERSEILGLLTIVDAPRPEARDAVKSLRQLGADRIVLLTGDNDRAAAAAAARVGIEDCKAELFPDDKVSVIHQARHDGQIVVMVGDGVNDAPALATADVGIAMGGIGSDISIEAADVVIMTDDLNQIAELRRFSRRVLSTIRHNIFWFAIVVNGVGVYASGAGYLSPVQAAIFHQISSFLVVCNSLRLLGISRFTSSGFGEKFAELRHRLHSLRHDLEDLNWEWFLGWLYDRRRGLGRALLVAAPVVYLLSGFYSVGPDERATLQRFGRLSNSGVEPGLGFYWPWPVGKIRKLDQGRIRRAEIGFRTEWTEAASDGEGTLTQRTVEWNSEHVAGRYRIAPEESLILTGDEQLVVTMLAIHYRVGGLTEYLYGLEDPEELIRLVGEAALGEVAAEQTMDRLLTSGRIEIEKEIERRMQERLDAYESGMRIVGAHFVEVHPPIDVVDAFRSVASALEEKQTRINEAEAYRNKTLALARGQAGASLSKALAYNVEQIQRAEGQRSYLLQAIGAYRRSPEATKMRLYLESIERIPAKTKKYIIEQTEAGGPNLIVWPEADRMIPPAQAIGRPGWEDLAREDGAP